MKLEVLVVDASGLQGSAVTRALLRVGHRVRAHVRSLAHPEAELLRQRGARLAWAGIDDEPRMREAMSGVDAVFATTLPTADGPALLVREGLMLMETARSVGIEHFVHAALMSSEDAATEVERYLRTVGVTHTVIHAGFLMENLLDEAWLPALRSGRLPLPLSSGTKLQQLAAADLARFVRLVMERREEFVNRRICIAADELTPLEMAATLARVTGHPVQHVPLDRPPEQNALAPLYDLLERQGGCADVAGLRRDHPDVNWHTLDGWAKRQRWTE